MTHFKSREHFCNYCRVIINTKREAYNGEPISRIMEEIYDYDDKIIIKEFVSELCHLEIKETCKLFNKQLRALRIKYGIKIRGMKI